MDCKMGLWVINGSVRGRRMDVLLNTKGAFFFLTGMVPVHMKDYVLAEKRIKEKNSFCHFSPISSRIKTSSRQFEACATLFLGRRQHLRIIVRTSLHHLSLHLVPQSWILGPRVYIFRFQGITRKTSQEKATARASAERLIRLSQKPFSVFSSFAFKVRGSVETYVENGNRGFNLLIKL